jgi:hypothetical protein
MQHRYSLRKIITNLPTPRNYLTLPYLSSLNQDEHSSVPALRLEKNNWAHFKACKTNARVCIYLLPTIPPVMSFPKKG